MKSTLVVFYSRTGNTRRAAERLAKALDADLEEIREARDRAGAAGFLRSGYEAVSRRCPPILPPRKAPRDYARVVLGTPVWAGRMASPVRSWLQGCRKDLRRLALFATCGAGGAEAALGSIEQLAGVAAEDKLILTERELAAGAEARLTAFADHVLHAA